MKDTISIILLITFLGFLLTPGVIGDKARAVVDAFYAEPPK